MSIKVRIVTLDI
uniref:Uncharacterized protein n=1 Tax=Rhizophora mucronata TaxID=61149 RepID=A0A2P2N311_RHIMU